MKDFYKLGLSIVIPIHKESLETIEKGLSHYKAFDVLVHIIDSSQNRTLISYDSNIRYHHLPGISFLEKIRISVEVIDTKFVLLAPIDDICYLDKIIHKYQNLIKLDDFAYLGGEYSSLVSFNEYNNIVKYSVASYIVRNLDSKSLFCNYRFPLLWGIYSNEILNKLLSILTKYKFENDNFIELSVIAILPQLGKVYETEESFFYRSSGYYSWNTLHKAQNIFDLIKMTDDQKTYLKLLKDRKTSLILFLSYIAYLTKNSIKKTVLFKAIIKISLITRRFCRK